MRETWETQVRSLGREDPLEKGMATHSSILAWRTPWTEEPGNLQSIRSHRVGYNWCDLAGMHASNWAWLVIEQEAGGRWVVRPETETWDWETHRETEKETGRHTERETEQGGETVRDRETSDRANVTGTAEPPPDPISGLPVTRGTGVHTDFSLPCFVEKVDIWSPTTSRDFSQVRKASLISRRASLWWAGTEPGVRFVIHRLGLGLGTHHETWLQAAVGAAPHFLHL